VELAKKFGFAACDLSVNAVRETADAGDQSAEAAVETAREVAQRMKNLGISPGSCGGIVPGKLSVPEDEWSSAMDDLGERLRVARVLGFSRTTAVMLPFHEELPFDQCFTLHVDRLNQVAGPLADAGFRLGIEYVSQKTRRAGYPHEFLYDLDGTLRLLEAVAAPNVGVLLDSFHWFCAEETVDDVRRLASEQVVVVHVNDSIAGRSMDEQVAFERELPGATGIIDLAGLLRALRDIGYDGPVTAEPMDKSLKAMADDDALAATANAFESIGM
jgi:sugar phosphate isomerase/epimerase